jgi:hypothetical protein
MAARKTKGTKDVPWPDATRERIRASMLEKELIKHIAGKRDMTQTQFAAAKTLLNKVLPDLTENQTKVSGEITIVRKYFGADRNPK